MNVEILKDALGEYTGDAEKGDITKMSDEALSHAHETVHGWYKRLVKGDAPTVAGKQLTSREAREMHDDLEAEMAGRTSETEAEAKAAQDSGKYKAKKGLSFSMGEGGAQVIRRIDPHTNGEAIDPVIRKTIEGAVIE